MRHEAPGIVVMYLCGADHAINCGLLHGVSSTIPVVAVARFVHQLLLFREAALFGRSLYKRTPRRPGYTARIAKLPRTEAKCFYVEMEMEDLSSTAIRKRYNSVPLDPVASRHHALTFFPTHALRLAASESVEDLTGPAVSQYLFKNQLHKLFAK